MAAKKKAKAKQPLKKPSLKKKPLKPAPKSWQTRAREFINSAIFGKLYLAFSLLVVLSTTIYWSLLGARLQLGNADQLVNTQLFKTSAIFHGATFPGAHSFLIKWPLFWLANVLGSTNSVINLLTVCLVVLTVGLLLAVIYHIERRPMVFGTICLALASVLLLVPAAPYAGAILPAQLTTSCQISPGEGRKPETTGARDCRRSNGSIGEKPKRKSRKAVPPETARNTTMARISTSHLNGHDFLDNPIPDQLQGERRGQHFVTGGIVHEEPRINRIHDVHQDPYGRRN